MGRVLELAPALPQSVTRVAVVLITAGLSGCDALPSESGGGASGTIQLEYESSRPLSLHAAGVHRSGPGCTLDLSRSYAVAIRSGPGDLSVEGAQRQGGHLHAFVAHIPVQYQEPLREYIASNNPILGEVWMSISFDLFVVDDASLRWTNESRQITYRGTFITEEITDRSIRGRFSGEGEARRLIGTVMSEGTFSGTFDVPIVDRSAGC